LTHRPSASVFALYGIINGFLQVLVFATVIRRFGAKRVIVAGGIIYPVIYALFPVINQLARVQGVSLGVYAILAFQLFLTVAFCVSFGA